MFNFLLFPDNDYDLLIIVGFMETNNDTLGSLKP